MSRRPSVAVVGGGISGLSAAYVLSATCDVEVFERDVRLGGHAHTHTLPGSAGPIGVDSGFIVYNERTYPVLTRLFAELEVSTQATEMSLAIRCDGCGLEYCGARGLGGVFAQRRNATSPRFLRLLTGIAAFQRAARRFIVAGDDVTTLGEFITGLRLSADVVDHYVLPLVACVWSASTETARRYPARYLFRFLENHGTIQLCAAPQWRSLPGGSVRYVERIAARLPGRWHTGTPIAGIRRHPTHVEVAGERFDAVVIASHADDALACLADPDDDEVRLLGAWQYSRNETLLHSDARLLPRSASARASWNYHVDTCGGALHGVTMTYDMNRLQRLDEPTPYLVTLNRPDRVDPDTVHARVTYTHPIYTAESLASQRELRRRGQVRRTVFAGAHLGYGFHEDGAVSGVRAARALGVAW